MKVWIVAHDVEPHIPGVFGSEELARAYISGLSEVEREWFDCYEYELNETKNS